MSYTPPDDPDVVTDHDPGGVQWATGNVEASVLDATDELTAAPGQTHRTTALLGVDASHTVTAQWPTQATRADAVALLDPSCPADADDWRAFALVPAQVADGELRPRGDAWSDLLCALALAVGRPGTNTTSPLHCEHDTLTLCADPHDFTDAECDQMRAWGFMPSGDGAWMSHRFGSA